MAKTSPNDPLKTTPAVPPKAETISHQIGGLKERGKYVPQPAGAPNPAPDWPDQKTGRLAAIKKQG